MLLIISWSNSTKFMFDSLQCMVKPTSSIDTAGWPSKHRPCAPSKFARISTSAFLVSISIGIPTTETRGDVSCVIMSKAGHAILTIVSSSPNDGHDPASERKGEKSDETGGTGRVNSHEILEERRVDGVNVQAREAALISATSS